MSGQPGGLQTPTNAHSSNSASQHQTNNTPDGLQKPNTQDNPSLGPRSESRASLLDLPQANPSGMTNDVSHLFEQDAISSTDETGVIFSMTGEDTGTSVETPVIAEPSSQRNPSSTATFPGGIVITPAAPTQPPSARARGIPACVNCRKSKVKCEGGTPCVRCIRLHYEPTCTRERRTKRGTDTTQRRSSVSSYDENRSSHSHSTVLASAVGVNDPSTSKAKRRRTGEAKRAKDEGRKGAKSGRSKSKSKSKRSAKKAEQTSEQPVAALPAMPTTAVPALDPMQRLLQQQSAHMLGPNAPNPVLGQNDAHMLERLLCLHNLLKKWSQRVNPSTADGSLYRFLWFCEFSRVVCEDYYAFQLRTSPASTGSQSGEKPKRATSGWLCDSILSDIQQIYGMVSDSVQRIRQFRHVDPMSSLHRAVTYEVFKRLPHAVFVVRMLPIPFSAHSLVWFNERLLVLLGMSQSTLIQAFSKPSTFFNLLSASSSTLLLSNMLGAIAARHTSFNTTLQWRTSPVKYVELCGTHKLHYQGDVPSQMSVFLQVRPATKPPQQPDPGARMQGPPWMQHRNSNQPQNMLYGVPPAQMPWTGTGASSQFQRAADNQPHHQQHASPHASPHAPHQQHQQQQQQQQLQQQLLHSLQNGSGNFMDAVPGQLGSSVNPNASTPQHLQTLSQMTQMTGPNNISPHAFGNGRSASVFQSQSTNGAFPDPSMLSAFPSFAADRTSSPAPASHASLNDQSASEPSFQHMI